MSQPVYISEYEDYENYMGRYTPNIHRLNEKSEKRYELREEELFGAYLVEVKPDQTRRCSTKACLGRPRAPFTKCYTCNKRDNTRL